MRACWVPPDHGTVEFVARAGVATVHLSSVVDSFHTMPPPHFPEVVFLGWSNVGKSSLINSLLHRSAVAPVSKMPGKTTQFHFYTINERLPAFPQMTLVDVPGLGEAMADDAQMRHWQMTLDMYLQKRGGNLRQVFHLISCEILLKNGRPSSLDMAVMEMGCRYQRERKLNYTVVITKNDLIRSTRDVQKVYHTMCKMSRKAGFQRPQVIAASVRKPIGRVQIWKKLWRSVEKDEQRGLPQLRKELDALVAAEDVAALRAAVEQATGADAWDYALRAMLRVSSGALRREVWGLVRNTSPEPGVEMLLADQDTDLDDLQESLLEAAELDEEEEEALKEEQPQEPEEEPEEEEEEEEEEEQEATNLFQPKEGLLLSAAQERAALAVGEVAFQADPPDLELAEEVLRELQGPPLAELLPL
ncbi:unnamed protein product [Effrenium voratum]|uniref:EngB-type G domain-containing protein n=1 Tax=Effrenium voratum TaxID=2562239 RepID=A0AA36I5M3_9DINO|nr:unnamed protein product [Effrenium voratum]